MPHRETIRGRTLGMTHLETVFPLCALVLWMLVALYLVNSVKRARCTRKFVGQVLRGGDGVR